MDRHDVFDYVVVGGGTTGAVVAGRLAEDRLASVCLVEAGPRDDEPPEASDIATIPNLIGSRYDYAYRGSGNETGDEMTFSAGRLLGGSSVINGGVSFLAQMYDLELWAKQIGASWGPEQTEQYFKRVLDRVSLEAVENRNPCAEGFVQAARQLGFPVLDAMDRAIEQGVVRTKLAKRGKLPVSSSVAYLHPLDSPPPNLTILTNQRVDKVLLDESGAALGVAATDRDIQAAREVVLCCGAVGTPRILLLSGIGPSEHLRAVGVDVKVDLPGVGERLGDHPEVVLLYVGSKPTTTESSQSCEAVLFAGADPVYPGPALEFHHFVFELDLFYGIPRGAKPAQHMFSIAPSINRTRSEGAVRLRSRDVEEPPAIKLRLFQDDGTDEGLMMEGVRLGRSLAQRAELRSWIEREVSPGEAVQSDAELREYVRAHASTGFHLFGTCRMGPWTDRLAVTDERLRVRGTTRLRVADASVFPESLSVNPAITCMMVGEKCADLIHQESNAAQELRAIDA